MVDQVQAVHCPNCGRFAERRLIAHRQRLELSCGYCDYLLVCSSQTGSIIEAYAPGLTVGGRR